VFHLAALLSTRSEFTPLSAHQVNVEGTLNLLEFAQHEAESHGNPVIFMYPSSIAVYGLPSLDEKKRVGRVSEDLYTHPTTMYGCNKLYCEQLGHYYSRFYKQLAAESASGRVDFRCVRFPGLISAVTMPSGGTSDYAPEMIHAAARGEPYEAVRAAGRAHPVHGDARRRRRAAAAGRRTARRADPHGLQRRRVQSLREEVRRSWRARFRRRHLLEVDASARASSTPGPPPSTTAPPGATGASTPRYEPGKAFEDYLSPMIPALYARSYNAASKASTGGQESRRT
jgi:nucleoside-diphosphate-sugar epimerase